MIATLLQVVGLVLLAAGIYIWFGPGPALVAAGVSSTVAGTAAELDKRRRTRPLETVRRAA